MPFSEPYDETFESPEPLDEAQVEYYAMLFLKATYPDTLGFKISDQEKERLQSFFKEAHPAHEEAVRVRMLYLQRFFEYTNPNISFEEKTRIQIEMDKIPTLKDFIERRYLVTLTDAYIIWRDALRRADTDKDTQAILGEFEMNSDDAYALCQLLEKYPDIVDERFTAASFTVEEGLHINSPKKLKPDENLYKDDHLKLLALKKSMDSTISPEGRAYLDKVLREDPHFKIIADKIQSALRG